MASLVVEDSYMVDNYMQIITHGAGVGRLVGGGDGLNVRLSHSVPK
jgi:hypothetical protein